MLFERLCSLSDIVVMRRVSKGQVMIFIRMQESNGWMMIDYSATWRYGYDFMLDAAQVIIDTDFKENLQRVAAASTPGAKETEMLDEVRACGRILRDCKSLLKEQSNLIISGLSRIMESPVQFVFYNQTNIVRLFCPDRQYFEKRGEHVFDNYINSVEIRAYCKDTERRTIENYKNARE